MLAGGSAPALPEDINPSGCCPCRGPAGGTGPERCHPARPCLGCPQPLTRPPRTAVPSPRSWEGAAGRAEPPGKQQGADGPHTPRTGSPEVAPAPARPHLRRSRLRRTRPGRRPCREAEGSAPRGCSRAPRSRPNAHPGSGRGDGGRSGQWGAQRAQHHWAQGSKTLGWCPAAPRWGRAVGRAAELWGSPVPGAAGTPGSQNPAAARIEVTPGTCRKLLPRQSMVGKHWDRGVGENRGWTRPRLGGQGHEDGQSAARGADPVPGGLSERWRPGRCSGSYASVHNNPAVRALTAAELSNSAPNAEPSTRRLLGGAQGGRVSSAASQEAAAAGRGGGG